MRTGRIWCVLLVFGAAFFCCLCFWSFGAVRLLGFVCLVSFLVRCPAFWLGFCVCVSCSLFFLVWVFSCVAVLSWGYVFVCPAPWFNFCFCWVGLGSALDICLSFEFHSVSLLACFTLGMPCWWSYLLNSWLGSTCLLSYIYLGWDSSFWSLNNLCSTHFGFDS